MKILPPKLLKCNFSKVCLNFAIPCLGSLFRGRCLNADQGKKKKKFDPRDSSGNWMNTNTQDSGRTSSVYQYAGQWQDVICIPIFRVVAGRHLYTNIQGSVRTSSVY